MKINYLKYILICIFAWGFAELRAQDSIRIDSIPVDTAQKAAKASKLSGKNKGNANNSNPNTSNNPDSSKKTPIAVVDTSAAKRDTTPVVVEKVKKKNGHSPKKALRWAFLPGAGQIYNRRYWKLPIVYAGLGGLGYWYVSSRIEYRCYRKAYIAAADSDPNTNYVCPSNPTASVSVLKLQRDYYRSQSEYALLGGIVFYALTIADAFVDAHLKTFDISDDLSLNLRPSLQISSYNGQPQLGLAMGWQPKKQQLSKHLDF